MDKSMDTCSLIEMHAVFIVLLLSHKSDHGHFKGI